jgi:hypothetical protein
VTTLRHAAYQAEVRRIQAEYAAMPAVRDAILAQFQASVTISDAPTPGALDIAPNPRQREFEDLRWQASLAGKSEAEAHRLATAEIARRHDEAIPLEAMTLAELEAHAAAMPLPDAWNPNAGTRESDARSVDELAAAANAEYQASRADQKAWGEGLIDRVKATQAARAERGQKAYDHTIGVLGGLGVFGKSAEQAASDAAAEAMAAEPTAE